LAVCADGKISNYLIKAKKGVLSMGEQFPKFDSLSKLVNHFSHLERPGMAERLAVACPAPPVGGNASASSSGGGGGGGVKGKGAQLSKAERAVKKKRCVRACHTQPPPDISLPKLWLLLMCQP
jgi:hypothetical protein